ncbi:MAG: apolipoprotein N-acyltransferase [Candidatus Omnitrophota bacterium]
MPWEMIQDKVLRTKYKVKDFLLCILSAGLLIYSFPNFNIWLCAWIGFVPLFFAIKGKSKVKAFLLSYITGVIFWLGIVYWLIHVTLPGLIILVLYLALYFGFFGFLVSLFTDNKDTFPITCQTVCVPAIWVLLEYIRSHLFTGFPWALLGYSQYLNLPAIQIADIAGVWGVSFLVMLVNVAIFEIILSAKSKLKPRLKIISALLVLILLLVLSYGYYRLRPRPAAPSFQSVKVCVIQGNIPQELKWEPTAKADILEKYLRLAREAALEHPQLIIWPEAALPVVLEDEPAYLEKTQNLAKELRAPLLIGAVRRDGGLYYNSALLLSSEGRALNIYDKLHLVPFGEYIPLRNMFPFLETVVPIGDFTAGKEYMVFRYSKENLQRNDNNRAITEVKFSVLICFEDLFPELSREFVRQGADFLVNITNDAWFGRTSSPYQHLSASVLRAVENRVPLVRAANTGVSGFISPYGKIISLVHDEKGRYIFSEGYKTERIPLFAKAVTLYSRFGDYFIFVCLIFILYVIIALSKNPRSS